jgi:multimeric flavodoxin WrbA
MKKVLIVNSSPREQGNCSILCDEFGRGVVMNEGNEVNRIDLNKSNYDFFRENQEEEDDILNIAHQMMDANVIVLATPVYFYNMSGQLKVLIDRMMPYFTQIHDKDFYFILTAAISRSAMESAVDSLYGFTDSLNNCDVKSVIYGYGVNEKGDIYNHPALQEAYRIAAGIK